MIKICIASNNRNKIKQFGEIIAGEGICAETYSAGDLGFSDFPPEDAETFFGNSLIKASAVRGFLEAKGIAGQYYVLSDDSGICADALGGAPGVHSARFSGEHATDDANNRKLVSLLAAFPEEERTAHYSCVVTMIVPNGDIISGQGMVFGRVIDTPRGHDGFGYDPFFYVDPKGATFAELSSADRNAISHRGNALRRVIREIKLR
ncbi:MAG: non-canonical purine NTP pyrophosphatase [Clostridia bacterium]|nr:non-canonical purine NTP pyrophosphatase [Clostridia bacterium]